MAWTYFLMWHGIPPEEIENTFATVHEQEALKAAQELANRTERSVDVLRIQEGVVESAPYRTVHPRIDD